ncbi:hypothetical protein CC85DRAFT_282356 [Cutaneotrichosporon oleaginosum]|uniref:Ricin B lectin domain-containing protein n=1 Tax=Cutaneotrichosporon oleaginosum TaxID=879819 RepID=A0A0J1BCH8_9TREE|nr:uncharacterized protein CC85DRAFT_282356 [Cutaneotrichosporon oleaginosum]KLT45729.1 hypothetical protein CC85DRAFT_282356 [Cutaneotrichosporon oleaginosum]
MPTTLLLFIALASASPVPEGSLLPRTVVNTIRWRGDATRNQLTSCASAGPEGSRNGDRLDLIPQPMRYCGTSWYLNDGAIGTAWPGAPFTGRCIDSTLYPGNGVQPHMWDCYAGAWQQSWTHHANGQIELTGRGYCLDVRDGVASNGLQLWECVDGNINQQFDIVAWTPP